MRCLILFDDVRPETEATLVRHFMSGGCFVEFTLSEVGFEGSGHARSFEVNTGTRGDVWIGIYECGRVERGYRSNVSSVILSLAP